MAVRLDWRGMVLQHQIDSAIQAGLEETAAACVVPAKQRVRVRTRVLQGSIKVDPDGAKKTDRGWSILWGSFDVNYAKWQEIGTGIMSAQPYLRPAADIVYPELAERIQRRLLW